MEGVLGVGSLGVLQFGHDQVFEAFQQGLEFGRDSTQCNSLIDLVPLATVDAYTNE
jgi:hypothetical protein